jgi:hypothetical protein
MEGIKWITYKGKEILFVDYGVTKSDEDVIKLIAEVGSTLTSRPQGSILYLTNMNGAHVSPSSMKYYKDGAAVAEKTVKAWGAYGLSAVKKMILDIMKKTIGMKTTVFNTEEEAKDWIVMQ